MSEGALSLAVIMLLLIVNFLLLVAFVDLARGYRMMQASQHTYCVSAIGEFVSDRLISDWLMAAADRWDSPGEKHVLQRLADTQYTVGGPSMPALWMRHEAHRLNPLRGEGTPEYNLNGERVI